LELVLLIGQIQFFLVKQHTENILFRKNKMIWYT